jgi:hypothetical protein
MFTIEYAKDLKWVNPEHTTFDCVVKFAEFNEEMNFACMQLDPYEHSQALWVRGNAGEFGPIAEYVEYVDNREPAPDQPVAAGVQIL